MKGILKVLSLCLVLALLVPAFAVAEEEVDTRPRTVVTTDLECDDIDSLLHLLLYSNDIDIAADDPRRPAFDANRQAEIEAVKPVIERLKETGWTFGSHTWGHIRLDSRPLESVQRDTVRWAEEVGSLVGPTNILFYPHGGRPDGDDWHSTGPVFQYLQSQGFRIFASVGINSFSYIKKDISAVICDRLHPDGTTLRNGKALEWYSQFYDAREIIDLDVRPDLGVTW